MKKITFLLFLFAAMAIGQTPQSIAEFAESGLSRVPDLTEVKVSQNNLVRSENAIVATYTDRDTYLAECSNGDFLTLEDFSGGPSTISECGEIISSAGNACYPTGELEDGFEISASTIANGTVYIDPNDGFGIQDPVVGSNTFVDFTVITFTGDEVVTSAGFDVYSLLDGSPVDVRVIGEGGLIDTITLDVTTAGPVFLGIVADEPILSIELEDLSGVNVEMISQFLFGTCGPQELNDDPETAATLTVGEVFEDFPVIGDNTEATATAIDDPSCGSFAEADLWYTFVVPESGSVTVESQEDDGSITDTAISLYEGEVGALVEVVCNDDGGIGAFSMLEVEDRTPGEVLYARIWEFNGGSLGTFQISAYDTPPPANDDLDGVIALTVGSVFTDFPEIGSNVSATDSEVTDTSIIDPTCSSYQGGDIWYSVIVPTTGQIIVETNRVESSSVTDTGMSIYEGEIGALTEVECDDDDSDDGNFSLISLVDRTPGEILYIRVFEFGNNSFGAIQTAAYSDCAVNGGEITLPNGSTEGEICIEGSGDAVDVTLGGMVMGTNSQWVITDTDAVILELPAPPPFDLTAFGETTVLIWHLSFEDGLMGAAVGESALDLEGCFDLSNPITAELVVEGGVCETCDYTLEMNDSFGDGWNGATIDVIVDGVVVLDDVSLDTDPNNNGIQGILSIPVNSTADVSTVFGAPGGFPGEISYRILDVEGNEVATGDVDNNVESLIADCPSCLAPSDLLAENVTDVSADLSWSDPNDPQAMSYDLEWGEAGFALGTGTLVAGLTDTTFQLTGLDVATSYDFYVASNCAADDASNFTGPFNFDTLFEQAPPGECEYTLQMLDSFGDGWNGALLNVFRNGLIVLQNVSLDDDPASDGSTGVLTFEILPGDDITTQLVDGGGFPGEISYNILDTEDEIVGTGNADTDITSGTISGVCDPLSVDDNRIDGFNFYPNPAQDRINLDAQQSIEQVTIFNMLGQQVLNQKVGVANTQLDVSNLASGNYIMQVMIDGQKGIYKVLKQ